MTDDDDRIAYLEGDDLGTLDPADRAELDALRALLADASTWIEPPASLEDDVVAAITGAARGPAESRPPAAAAPSVPPPPPPVRERHRGRRRWLVAVGGLAAAALAAVGITAAVRSGDNEGPRFEVALAPTDLIPDARGEAKLVRTDSGWRVELDATGLPRLDQGRFYQAWLRNAQGVLVPIGSFNEGEDVTLWAGVSPVDFPMFTVTIEAADGDQASSGQRVLTGQVQP